MIQAAHEIGGFEFNFRLPPTAADLLDWRLWAFCVASGDVEKDAAAFVIAAGTWAAQWLEPAGGWDIDTLTDVLAECADKPFDALVELCNAIADACELPHSVVQDMRTMLDRKNDVPVEWKPSPVCRCRKCTGKAKGLEIENATGEVCVFDGIDTRAEIALALVPYDVDLNERPYVVQVRTVINTAENRRMQYKAENEKAKEQSRELLAEARQRMGV